ncbi:MAG: TolB family protein, partial [Rudaea sp.]
SGDLDVWVMNADGSKAVNLTPDEPAYDFGPAWSPKGDLIAFTSLANEHKQVWTVSPDGKQLKNISNDQFDEEQPTWSPDGKRIAFVSNAEGCEKVTDRVALDACQRHEITVADWDGNRLQNRRQISMDGDATQPSWSPDGQELAFVSPRPGRQMLFIGSTQIGQPTWTSPASLWVRSATWGPVEYRSYGEPDNPEPLYTEKPIAAQSDAGHAYELRPLKNVYLAPSWGQLSSRVAESFLALRARLQKESGHDFLGVLSDMTRALDSRCGKECDNLSWHKSGRAIDTRLEYFDSTGRSAMEIVREDQSGETFWRVWIRAAVQDGSMGEPLKEQPWDLSDRSRSVLGPEQGGVRSPIPGGYYIDLTDLARLYGWNRISSHDDPEFDWRWNRLAMEYWHFQKTDRLNWYDALSELYSPSEVAQFEWTRIARDWDVDSLHLYLKGIPPPPDAWEWFALLPRPNE